MEMDFKIENPLDSMMIIMSLDSRDWTHQYRDRMLYAIVFGIDGLEEEYKAFGYTDETIEHYKLLHDRFEKLRKIDFRKGVTL